MCGNASDPEDTGEGPDKSYLFLLTSPSALEGDYPEIGQCDRESAALFAAFGALSTVLENSGESIIFPLGRTHNRIRSPR